MDQNISKLDRQPKKYDMHLRPWKNHWGRFKIPNLSGREIIKKVAKTKSQAKGKKMKKWKSVELKNASNFHFKARIIDVWHFPQSLQAAAALLARASTLPPSHHHS